MRDVDNVALLLVIRLPVSLESVFAAPVEFPSLIWRHAPEAVGFPTNKDNETDGQEDQDGQDLEQEKDVPMHIQLRAALNSGEVDIIAGLRQVGKGFVCKLAIPH
jgi:hypothetical protein